MNDSQRGNMKRGPQLDDQLEQETRGMVQGHGSPHAEPFRETEPLPDDTDDQDVERAFRHDSPGEDESSDGGAMIGSGQLVALLEEPGPWTYAYVDGQGAEPQAIEGARRESVRRRLDEGGAPEADTAAVIDVLVRAESGMMPPWPR